MVIYTQKTLDSEKNWHFCFVLKATGPRWVNSPVRDIVTWESTVRGRRQAKVLWKIFEASIQAITQRRLRIGDRQTFSLELTLLLYSSFACENIKYKPLWHGVTFWIILYEYCTGKLNFSERFLQSLISLKQGARNNILFAQWMRLLQFNHGELGLTELFLTFACLLGGSHHLFVCKKLRAHSETWFRLNH